MIEFIFMLTRDDVTLSDAREVYASIAQSGVRHVGCKDVGLPTEELKALMDEIRANGHESWIEVVSETEEDTLASARAAAEIGPDHLIGGTLIEPVQEILAGTGVKFWPYVGRIVGHPCLLRGSIDEIVADTQRAAELGVDGINLLAYRYDGDVEELTARRRRRHRPAGHLRRLGRLRRAHPRARELRRLGLHDRHGRARRRACRRRAVERAAAGGARSRRRRPGLSGGAARRAGFGSSIAPSSIIRPITSNFARLLRFSTTA